MANLGKLQEKLQQEQVERELRAEHGRGLVNQGNETAGLAGAYAMAAPMSEHPKAALASVIGELAQDIKAGKVAETEAENIAALAGSLPTELSEKAGAGLIELVRAWRWQRQVRNRP